MITWGHWHNEPLLLGGILTVVWLYHLLTGPFRTWVDPEAPPAGAERFYFWAGVLLFYGAVGSPLDALGEGFLFSAHMVQHLILMYGAAWCLIQALPGWLIDGLLRRVPRIQMVLRVLTQPVVAGLLFTLVFCGWHFPVLYEAALRSKSIHALEHMMMFGSSVLMLWPIVGRSKALPRSPHGVQLLYVFLLMVAQIPLFGILTFSPEILYPTYELAPRVCFLDAAQDQVLGGLIMKVGNMVLSMIFFVRAFVRWNREA